MRGLHKEVARELGGVDREFQTAGKRSGGVFGTAVGTAAGFIGGKALWAAGEVAGKAFTGGLSRFMNLESAEAQLKALKFSARDIDRIMKLATASVKGTAFAADQAAGAAGTMVNAGVRGNDELKAAMRTLVNTAAIARQDLGETGLIFGKIAQKGKLDGETLAQLTERNIPVIDNLAKHLGKTEEQVYKLVRDGKINFETFRKAMDAGMDPRAAIIMGETLKGTWENTLAALNRVGAAVIDRVAPSIKQGLGIVTDSLDALEGQISGIGEGGLSKTLQLSPETVSAWSSVQDTFSRIGTAIKDDLWPPARDLMGGFFDKQDLIESTNDLLSGTADVVGGVAGAVEGAIPEVAKFVGWLDRMTSPENRQNQWDPAVTVNEWGTKLRQAWIEEWGKPSHRDPWTDYSNRAGRWLNEGFRNMGSGNDWVASAGAWLRGKLAEGFTSMGTGDDPIARAGAWLRGRIAESIKGLGTGDDPVASAGAWLRGKLVEGFTTMGSGDDPIARAGAWARGKIVESVKGLGTGDDPVASAGAWVRKQLIDGFLGMGTGDDPVAQLGAGVRRWFAGIPAAASDSLAPLQSVVGGRFDELKTVGLQRLGELRDGVLSRMGEIAASASTRAGEARDMVGARFGELRANVGARMGEARDDASARAGEMRDRVSLAVQEARDRVSARLGELRANAQGQFNQLVASGVERFTTMRENSGRISSEMRDRVTSRISEMRDNGRNRFNEMVANATERFTTMRETAGRTSAELRDRVTARFNETRSNASATWSDMWGRLRSTGDSIMGQIRGGISTGLGAIERGFGSAVSGISGAWSRLREAAAAPVRFAVNTVYDSGIKPAFNKIATAFGIPRLPDARVAFKTGGILPGFTPGRDVHRFFSPTGGILDLSGGEPVMRPELGRLIGVKGVELLNRAARKGAGALGAAFDALGHQRFAAGGIIGFRGHRFTSQFASRIVAAERMVGRAMSITQGGWRPATSYSGTSHAGDALDIAGAGFRAFIGALRAVGIAAWDRTGKGNWIPHVHGVPLPGSGVAGGSGIWQAQDYLRGGDGLGGRDNGPRVGIGANIQGLLDALGSLGDQAFDIFTDITGTLKGLFRSHLDKLGGGTQWKDLVKAITRRVADDIAAKAKDKIPGFMYGGTVARSGRAWLSEDGRPEMVIGPQVGNVRAGSTIVPWEGVQQLIGDAGGPRIHVTINNPVAEPASESILAASGLVSAQVLTV